jgi:hypothetical protein
MSSDQFHDYCREFGWAPARFDDSIGPLVQSEADVIAEVAGCDRADCVAQFRRLRNP